MEYDYKELLSLLAGHRSEDTRRAHRNVSITSFVIVAAWLMDIRITDVEAFGLDIRKDSEVVALAVATVLLIYWTGTFWMHLIQDREIQKERSLALDEKIKPAIDRLAVIEKKVASGGNAPGDHGDVKTLVQAYSAQKSRTKLAAQMLRISSATEWVVPNLLALIALIALCQWFARALAY